MDPETKNSEIEEQKREDEEIEDCLYVFLNVLFLYWPR